MRVLRRTSRVSVLLSSGLALLAILGWVQPAAAFHVIGFSLTVTSVDSVTGSVDIDVTETTTGGGSPHVAAFIAWGDAVSSANGWTSTTGVAPKVYKVSLSHTYPDIATRMITGTSDSNAPSPLQDTAQIDFGCSDTPIGLCLAAGKSLLKIKNNTIDDTKDKFLFKWLNGAATSFGALGVPTSSTQYFVCVYAPGLVFQSIVPAGANWSVNGASTQYKYKDNSGAAGGMTFIKLKSGLATKAQVLVKGKGPNLDDPLPLTQPVTVQVQNSVSECWEHQFTSPETKNDSEQFKDREP